jgi:alpha-glucosidase (family GH31 glycosyl hydrolase)
MLKMKFLLCMLCCSSILFGQNRAGGLNPSNQPDSRHNPKAQSDAMVTDENVRFTILTDKLIRMEYSPTAVFEDKASLTFLNRNLSVPKYSKSVKSGWLTIQTNALTLKYKKGTGAFNPENLMVELMVNGKKTTWHYGDTDKSNLLGTTRTLDNACGDTIPWYNQKVKLEQGLVSRSGWALVDDSKNNLFDGATDWNWVTPRDSKDVQDLYFFGYGLDYKQALYDYTQVAGKIPMPPKYAFGYWWCKYWAYTDTEMKGLVTDLKAYNIPVDVAIIDMDWHPTDGLSTRKGWHKSPKDLFGQTKGWTGYTWNTNLFPNAPKMLEWMETSKVKNALNLHPASGVSPQEKMYVPMIEALKIDTNKPMPYDKVFGKKVGWDTVSIGKSIPFDITNKTFAKSYFNVLIRSLEKQGVDFWWLDWQQWGYTPIEGLNPTWWLNYCFFTDMERNTNNRPFLFHRWGGMGNHRYQIGFSGDTYINWKSLAFQPYFTSTASNVGYGYWSHDIGGHMYVQEYDHEARSAELYIRWLQFGAFSPIMRTHGGKNPFVERRIFAYPVEDFKVMREAIRMRYAIAPYVYSQSRIAYDSAVSICHPMYYDYPKANEAYTNKQQYMFGSDMIVSPVVDSLDHANLLAKAKVWLPDGEWMEWFTGKTLKGGKQYERNFAINEIPVYVKSGAIIPMLRNAQNLQQKSDTIVLTIFPGKSGKTTVYEDDGKTNKYVDGAYATTAISQQSAGKTVKLHIEPRKGTYEGISDKRSFIVDLPNTLPIASATVNGQKAVTSYLATTLTSSVQLNLSAASEAMDVVLEFEIPLDSMYALTDGLRAKFSRLSTQLPIVKGMYNTYEAGNLPNMMPYAEQTPNRIQYAPESALKELKAFPANYSQAVQLIETLSLDANKIKPIMSFLKAE